MKEPIYAKLVEYKRNGLTEQVHFGLILHINKNGIIQKIGEDNNYKFYHRSCMKPLQASIMFDLELDKKLKLTLEEIAVCCASHSGTKEHQMYINNILKKAGMNEDDLLLVPTTPLSKDEQEFLLKNNLPYKKIHHNCSGKHALMLAICKELGYSTKNYKDLSHPLTDLIVSQVCKLCETNKDEIIISKDGCGLPVIATTLEQLGRGFLNLFSDYKYRKIKEAFLNFPILIGGYGRLDSEIIKSHKGLIAKVGACGLCVVVNIEKQECILVKIADSDYNARTITVLDSLKQLKWPEADWQISGQENNMRIYTVDNELIGQINTCFKLS